KLRNYLAAMIPAWPLWSWLVTVHAVVLAFLVFRAPSLSSARRLLSHLWTYAVNPLPVSAMALALITLLALLCQLGERDKLRLPRSEILRYGFLAAVMIALFVFSNVVTVSFLYQKF